MKSVFWRNDTVYAKTKFFVQTRQHMSVFVYMLYVFRYIPKPKIMASTLTKQHAILTDTLTVHLYPPPKNQKNAQTTPKHTQSIPKHSPITSQTSPKQNEAPELSPNDLQTGARPRAMGFIIYHHDQ